MTPSDVLKFSYYLTVASTPDADRACDTFMTRTVSCLRPFPTARGTLRRLSSASPAKWRPLPALPCSSLLPFQEQAFNPESPITFPSGTFCSLPAITNWFIPLAATDAAANTSTLNFDYLSDHDDPILPTELTSLSPDGNPTGFLRGEQPLSNFLAWTKLRLQLNTTPPNLKARTAETSPSLYLAQASLSLLPATLAADVPTPELVLNAGRGDIYDSSLWIGVPPTVTPLHCDPNPNLLVQLAGEKIVRLMDPQSGRRVVEGLEEARAKEKKMDRRGNIRGEEMMHGHQRMHLEKLVWGDEEAGEFDREIGAATAKGFEVKLGKGDGVFIPKGWWHAVKGVGQGGVSASVCTPSVFVIW